MRTMRPRRQNTEPTIGVAGLGEALITLKGDEATEPAPQSHNPSGRLPDLEWVEGEENFILKDGRTRLGFTADELAAGATVPALLRDPIGAPPDRTDGSVTPGWTKKEQAQVDAWWEAYPERRRPAQPKTVQPTEQAATPLTPKGQKSATGETGKKGELHPVRFLPDLKRRPRPRTRKKRVDAGTVYFTEKDRLLVQSVVAWGWLTFEQAGLLAGVSGDAIRKRARRLVLHGLLANAARNVNNEVCLIATARGQKAVGMDEGYPRGRVTMSRYDHHDACLAVAVELMLRSPGSVWMTEREVQAAVTREAQNTAARLKGQPEPWTKEECLSPRVRYLAPWMVNQLPKSFASWRPVLSRPSGVRRGHKLPDGFMLRKGSLPFVCEVELNCKGKGRKNFEKSADGRRHYTDGEYPAMKAAFARSALEGAISPVVHYFVSVAKGNTTAIRNAIEEADIPSAELELAAAKVKFTVQVHDVPEKVWAPFGHRYGWAEGGLPSRSVLRIGADTVLDS